MKCDRKVWKEEKAQRAFSKSYASLDKEQKRLVDISYQLFLEPIDKNFRGPCK